MMKHVKDQFQRPINGYNLILGGGHFFMSAAKGGTDEPPPSTTAPANGGAKKTHLYNPTSRPTYPAITGTVLYVLYRPHRPSFTLASFRIHRLNLTTSADSASSHLSTLFNLTISSKNPNAYLSFSYDPFTVSCVSSDGDVFLGNGTLPAFFSGSKIETTFRGVAVATSSDVDAETMNGLRPELKKKKGFLLKVEMDTRVMVKMGSLKSKKVGIRVTCDGIKGIVPKGKSPAVANVFGAKCEVDLRIKIWRWTF
ncbi:hypothetical protein ES332_D08G308200v1 [Gossypium tomentosum]|uniref:Late embryogenesis abundant protein LEA-2 subgroup domain-containing protein n=1 Tax=Gossypium tomentosum TaxID=34277 RepID=A0A5D2K3S8_GOSTO|nr:hypothetical protein ES332_D08G308200v1 [Gossypium tomentosum]